VQSDSDPEAEYTLRRQFSLEDVHRAPAPHSLEQIRGPGAPNRRQLNAERIVIGRAADISIESTITQHKAGRCRYT
jgi:hypothetical protein